MKNLDLLLEQDEKQVREEARRNNKRTYGGRFDVQGGLIKDLKLTQYVLDRAFTYARIVCQVLEEEVECIGYLTAPKQNNDRIVREVYFPQDQEVSSGFVKIEPEDVIKAGREIDKQGYKVLGWWHSHAGFNTFHSSTDSDNQINVLNAISPVNYITQINKKIIGDGNLEIKIEKGKLIVLDKRNKVVRYEFKLDGDGRKLVAGITGLNVIEEERVGFAYSLVVHNTGIKESRKEKQEGKAREEKEDEQAQFSKEKASKFQTSTGFTYPQVQGKYDFTTVGTYDWKDKWKKQRPRDPYAEVATRRNLEDGEVRDESRKVPMTIIPETGRLDVLEMKKEVKARIKERPKYTFKESWVYDGKGKRRKGKKWVSPSYDYRYLYGVSQENIGAPGAVNLDNFEVSEAHSSTPSKQGCLPIYQTEQAKPEELRTPVAEKVEDERAKEIEDMRGYFIGRFSSSKYAEAEENPGTIEAKKETKESKTGGEK